MYKKTLWGILILFLFSCSSQYTEYPLPIIPYPQEVTYKDALSDISGTLVIDAKGIGSEEWVASLESLQPATNSNDETIVEFRKTSKDIYPEEAYKLELHDDYVTIDASSQAGFMYGYQSLLQIRNMGGNTPQVVIEDAPRFKYRGMHLDVSRHFYDKEFIKKHLDELARYKINYFHWHLTDGAGWRLEIDAYPKLTDIAAWRPYKNWQAWWKEGRKYCNKNHPQAQGGYYTKKDVEEIIAYAALRNITVVPEIELPAHSEEVLAVYPELSCTGEPYKHADFCVGNEETFTFLTTVLDEVIELFPSRYIHLGGDEAGKGAWKTCPKCQKRMKEEGLDNVDELQSYMIRRIGQYIEDHGRQFIGWDEILEGGLAEGAIVMSWRGEEGGIKAAEMGHQVIMTPGSHCYFDSYQLDPSNEPIAIGGFLPVEKVYQYDPVPKKFTPEQASFILGVQGNVWTEYMPTYEHTEYMIYPRLLALAEVAWTDPSQKDWNTFKYRLNKQVEELQDRGVNACPLTDDVRVIKTPSADQKQFSISLETNVDPVSIFYTLDGSEPTHSSTLYKDTFCISQKTYLKARAFKGETPIGETTTDTIFFNKAFGKKIKYNNAYNKQYPAGGDQALINGLYGGYGYGDGRWQGFTRDLDVIVDLGRIEELTTVKAKFMQIIGPWVWYPVYVEVYTSNDGNKFKLLTRQNNTVSPEQDGVLFQNFGYEGKTTARYIRYKAKNYNGFLFTDELIIY